MHRALGPSNRETKVLGAPAHRVDRSTRCRPAGSVDGTARPAELYNGHEWPGPDDIYVMRPDGSDIHRLTNQKAYTPAWSPDGEQVVFSAPGVFVMDPDGTSVTAIPTSVGETSLPDWTQ
jgi:Tol biopolymer transport system component